MYQESCSNWKTKSGFRGQMVSLLPWSGNGYGKLEIKGPWSPVEAVGRHSRTLG